MYTMGHLGAGLLVYAPVYALVADRPFLGALGVLLTVLFCRWPDLDSHFGVSHRGPTHSIMATVWTALAAQLLALVVGVVVGASVAVTVTLGGFVYLVVGLVLLSHIVVDYVNPMGVAVLWPLTDRRFAIPVCKASNPSANVALLVAGLAAVFIAA